MSIGPNRHKLLYPKDASFVAVDTKLVLACGVAQAIRGNSPIDGVYPTNQQEHEILELTEEN